MHTRTHAHTHTYLNIRTRSINFTGIRVKLVNGKFPVVVVGLLVWFLESGLNFLGAGMRGVWGHVQLTLNSET